MCKVVGILLGTWAVGRVAAGVGAAVCPGWVEGK